MVLIEVSGKPPVQSYSHNVIRDRFLLSLYIFKLFSPDMDFGNERSQSDLALLDLLLPHSAFSSYPMYTIVLHCVRAI